MSDLERAFLFLLKAEKLPTPQAEYRFHPVRKWRFDFAYPSVKVAVELEGGAYTQGRHVRGQGFEKDLEKYNEAGIAGWTVLRFTAGMVDDGSAVETLRRCLALQKHHFLQLNGTVQPPLTVGTTPTRLSISTGQKRKGDGHG